MCGIGGIYYPDDSTPLSVESISDLWCGLENRGTHAAGFSLLWKGADAPVVYKAPRKASKHSSRLSRYYGNGKTTRYVLLHTRYTTQGSVENNGNNHPVVAHGITMTHNGVLFRDQTVFDRLGVSRVHDVDTEALNAALSIESPGWTLDNVEGSMSVAWTDDRDTEDTVHLMTNGGNPMVIGRLKSGGIVWASTLPHLQHLDLDSHFHATPFKHYWLTPDGAIRSEKVSEQTRPSNRAIRHASQFGGQGGGSRGFYRNSGSKTTKKTKKSKKTRSKALPVDWSDSSVWSDLSDWYYDVEIGAWTKR